MIMIHFLYTSQMASTPLGRWITENGGHITEDISLVKPPDDPSSRGVVADTNLDRGARLVVVPHRLLINRNTISRVLSEKNDSYPLYRLSSHQLIAWFLVRERDLGRKSRFAPFIESLPSLQDFAQSHPLMYSESQLSQLPGSTREMVETKVRDCFNKDFYAVVETCHKLALDPPGKSNDFLWAWLCVNTRCIYYEMGGKGMREEDKMTLAPFIDMLNHGPSLTCSTLVKPEVRGLVLRSCPNITTKAGNELILSYGAHSNEVLLAQYGFTLENNPHDCLDISLYLKELLSSSQKLLQQYGYWGGEYTMTIQSVSFRTTIALCCAVKNPKIAKNLILSGSGLDMDTARLCTNLLLDILQNKVIVESRKILETATGKDIINLHSSRLTIANSVKDQLLRGDMVLL